jgi:uncharacterized membrane protein
MQIANASGNGHQAARLNRLVQLALISGLSLSMLFMVAGAILFFLHNPGASSSALGLRAALPGIVAGNPMAYMIMGLIVLMVTPALRVCVAALGYLLDGEWGFALVSAGVVAVLVTSVLIGAS